MRTFLTSFRAAMPAILISFLILISCQTEPSNPSDMIYSYKGRVVDVHNVPVPFATVEALNASNRLMISMDSTDENGNFELLGMPENLESVLIIARHPNYRLFEQNLNFFSQAIRESKFQITLAYCDTCCGRIEIKVKDKNQNPLGGVEIRLYSKEQLLKKAVSDDTGNLVFNGICQGNYWIKLLKDRYNYLVKEFQLQECDTVRLNLQMESSGEEQDSCCHGVIKFYPKDAQTNQVINGATVKLWMNGNIISHKIVDGGVARFENICRGEYGVSFIAENYKSIEFKINLECNDTIDVTRNLEKNANVDSCCNNTLIVIPKDAITGQVLNGAAVKLKKNGTVVSYQTVAEGSARFEKICKGSYSVLIMAANYNNVEVPVEFGCGETKELVKYLEKNSGSKDSCCRGVVYFYPKDSESGTILNGTTIKLIYNGQILKSKVVEGGTAKFENLCMGSYQADFLNDSYNGLEYTFKLECNDTLQISKHLVRKTHQDTCCKGIIEVVVKDKASGSLVNGAKVKLLQNGTILTYKLTENGVAKFENLCQGTYGIAILATDYSLQQFEMTIGCNEHKEIIKYVDKTVSVDTCRTAVIKLFVKDEAALAIPNARVIITMGDKVITDTHMNAEGYFAIDGLTAPATYVVTIKKDGYTTKTITISFKECKIISETIVLSKL